MDDAGWSYAILGAAAVFEGASLAISVRQFKKSIGAAPFWKSLRTSKDPTLSTVIAEDSAALAGLAAAAIGIFGSHTLGMPAFDAGASIVIGLLLCGVSTLLIVQARGSSSARRSTPKWRRRSARSRRASRACTAPAGR
jgi:hypothetical protein